MSDSPARKFLSRLLGELSVIVLGVLVALQVDAWVQARDEARREEAQLEALRSDFRANSERFEATLEVQGSVMATAQALLSVMEQGSAVPADSIAYLFASATSWFEVEPITGAYDALIGSGDIGLLRNADLRRRLASFYGELDAGFEDHDNLMDLLAELQRETIVQFPALQRPGRRERIGLEPIDPTEPARAVVQNERFEGLLFLKTRLEENRIGRQSRLAAEVDTILSILNDELSNR